jgi:hypothetical protein
MKKVEACCRNSCHAFLSSTTLTVPYIFLNDEDEHIKETLSASSCMDIKHDYLPLYNNMRDILRKNNVEKNIRTFEEEEGFMI